MININMLEFLVDNLFVVFQQIVGIPMGTNCAPLLAGIFLYSYKAEFIQSLLSTGKKKLASQFNFTYRYIDDVLSINNHTLRIIWVKYIPLSLRSKTRRRATPLLPIWIYSCRSRVTVGCALPFTNVTISTSISQTFRSLSSNIPSSPAYGVFISQLIRYARACSSYECFILRAARLSSKLLGQGYVMERLKSSLRKFIWSIWGSHQKL